MEDDQLCQARIDDFSDIFMRGPGSIRRMTDLIIDISNSWALFSDIFEKNRSLSVHGLHMVSFTVAKTLLPIYGDNLFTEIMKTQIGDDPVTHFVVKGVKSASGIHRTI